MAFTRPLALPVLSPVTTGSLLPIAVPAGYLLNQVAMIQINHRAARRLVSLDFWLQIDPLSVVGLWMVQRFLSLTPRGNGA